MKVKCQQMSKIPKGTHLSGVWSAPPKSMYLDTQKCPAEPQSVNQTSPALGMSVVIAVHSLGYPGLFVTPMDCSTPDSSVLHYLPEFAQIHVH